MTKETGAVMVVGGGISGVQTALDLAESGFKVYMVERKPSIGGVMAQLDKTFPTNDCSMCILSPKLVEAARNPMITMMTLSEIVGVKGEAPNFTVTVKKHPRYVREDRCVGCGLCAEKCPSKAVNEYDVGLVQRKAIYVPYAQAVPMKYSIDEKKCLYLTKGRCGNCKKVCPADAVDYEMKESIEEVNVGSIVLAPGYEVFDAKLKKEYGYGEFKNVVTSLEFERILSATGPFQGHVVRPSDHKTPTKVAILQCVGSRDEKVGNNYCSSVCCMYALKQAIIAGEHTQGLQPTIFFMDIRAFGKEFEDYRARAEKEYGVKIHRGVRVASIDEDPETKNVTLRYSDGAETTAEEFDMAVLSVGFEPPASAMELSKTIGFKLNKYGFAETSVYDPLATSRKGVYVTGAFSAPKDIPQSVAEASGAASKAGSNVFQNRVHYEAKEIPEIQVAGQEPRIGVFVCDCGINIRGTVDVPKVVEYAKTLPNVVHAEEGKYTCSADFQEKIKQRIAELKLNRVVVASCTPRTHEPLFQSTIREAGLNPYLFEMANIRDQCSWIHMHEPEKATEKSEDLVRMAVAKARLLEPLSKSKLGVNHSAVVVGGGLAGMTAALDMANQGFPVHIIERSGELGGNLKNLKNEEAGKKPSEFLSEIVANVRDNEKITVHLNTDVADVAGFVGNFKVKTSKAEEIDAGAIVVAVGGNQYKPKEGEFGWGDHKVVTQWDLEEKLEKGPLHAKQVVMIQCVGSRNTEAPFCSRVCCTEAVKNAIKIKKSSPSTDVYVLHKDIRTYGFREDYYQEAGKLGVKFVRFGEDENPVVEKGAHGPTVMVHDVMLDETLKLNADLVVLSTGIRPNHDNEELGKFLKVPISKDGYFLEAHMKLRPVDFATNGIYLAGLAHWPKFIDETMAQASGAAARAMTIISKDYLETEGIIAAVNDMVCNGCGVCEPVCEYKAITIVKDEQNPDKLKAVVNEGLCKGCGTCVAACPSGAMEQKGFKNEQMFAIIDAALCGAEEEEKTKEGSK
ncbi:MAG TPA: CoB--CoM heterodisulfide reductase iron-sulfur subunit A family protein [Methanomassiliicoccales archaeon]|nr:CoB--CoM heterodisulfide reductase iron-sulfur subunit A family protein [Methanomassiliicoccales archaeon]